MVALERHHPAPAPRTHPADNGVSTATRTHDSTREEHDMRHCDGRRFDGSACNTDLLACAECATTGCAGDGCDNQRFLSAACDGCGATLGTAALAGVAA